MIVNGGEKQQPAIRFLYMYGESYVVNVPVFGCKCAVGNNRFLRVFLNGRRILPGRYDGHLAILSIVQMGAPEVGTLVDVHGQPLCRQLPGMAGRIRCVLQFHGTQSPYRFFFISFHSIAIIRGRLNKAARLIFDL